MPGHRFILALLLAFATSMSPLTGSWAANAPCAVGMGGSQAADTSLGGETTATQKASEAHCDDGNQLCPPEFCDAKCFPSLQLSSFAQPNPRVSAIDQQPNEPIRLRASPDRRHQPPPRI